MAVFYIFRLLYTHPYRTHHIIYGIIGAIFTFFSPLYGQEILPSINAYRTNLGVGAIGDWDDPTTWEVWDGTLWGSASVPPDRNNDVFIEKDNELRLTRNEEVANLYLYGRDSTESPPGRKLNLQVYDLNVYGALVCFRGVGGEYFLENLTSGITDWIYPETGNIVFKGSTRTIVDRASWSANNGRSSYGVVFDPHPTDTLFVNAGFKANRFTLRSGTVFQQVNYVGTPATSTFSFNNMSEYGTDDFGEFLIESGATLVSEGTKEFNQIVRRSDGKPASRFELREGGHLVLLGATPVIDAVNILLEGNVYYSGNSGTQHFISGSMTGVTDPSTYHHLFFEGAAVKQPPDFLELTGNFTFLGGGTVNTTDTAIGFTGSADQEVTNITLHLKEAEIVKPSGSLSFDEDLIVNDRFTMIEGEVDFGGNQLFILGDYHYTAGRWKNLAQLAYQNLPSTLTASNSTFPFVDAYLGGVRSISLSGSLSSTDTNLHIAYHPLPGINWDPGFDDNGVPILYALNSYFAFNLAGFTATDNLEVRISADNLIVVDDAHLRIIGNGAAAPGSHLPALDGLGGRAMTLADLNGQNLTLGSTGVASILPVTWLSYQAEELPSGILISWSTAHEEGNKEFVILKSTDAINFEDIGHVPGKGYSNKAHQYQFLDKSINLSSKIYYQIKQLDFNGSHKSSPVFQLILRKAREVLHIFPNPYENYQHLLTISVPEEMTRQSAHVRVKDTSGVLVMEKSGTMDSITPALADQIRILPAGFYIILIETNNEWQVVKWVKKN